MSASEQKNKEPKKLPGVFISYRRSDNPDAVGRIYDRLVSEFGKVRVFKDVDSIPLGQDFRSHLNSIVGGCAAVLAIVGPKWIDTRNAAGTRRLEDPDDFVRIELEAALARDIPVVPVLVGHAPMPGTAELPLSLASMAYRQSIEVRPDPDFHHDATRLVSALKAIIDPNAPRESAPGSAGAGPQPATVGGGPRNWRRFAWALAVAGVLVPLVTTVGIPAVRYWRAPPSQELRTDIVTPVTDDPGSFAISPDGKQIVFVARGIDGASRLWLRSLTKATAQPLAGTEGAIHPFWSPDSRSVAFAMQGVLSRLDLDGGQPQALTSSGLLSSGSWSKGGVILFSTGPTDPLSRIAASGGKASALPRMGPDSDGNVLPVFLSDGQHFLFQMNGLIEPGIYLGSLEGDAPVRLTGTTDSYAYSPSGWLLWIRAGALVAQKLDVDDKALVGNPVTVADGVLNVSASARGFVAYRLRGGGQRQLTWVDRSGSMRVAVGSPDESLLAPRVSPTDGRHVAFARETQGTIDIWLQDDTRAAASRVTFESAASGVSVWSPDGRRLAYVSQGGTSDGFYQKLTNGARAQELVLKTDRVSFPSSWSADGRYLLYFTVAPVTGLDIWVLPLDGDHKPFPFLATPSGELWGQFSPDGKWVAYQSNESRISEVYVRRFVVPGDPAESMAAQEGQWQVSTAGGVFPTWRADGKELFFVDPAGMLMAAPITVSGSTVVPGTPAPLFQSQILGGGVDGTQGRQYDVAPDGRFIINRVLDTETAPITLIQNWNPDADR